MAKLNLSKSFADIRKVKDRELPFVIKSMRNQAISKTVIAVTLLFLAVATGLYFFSGQGGLGKAAMKTYSNDTYGVAFDYPPAYNLTETSKGDQEGGPGVVVTLMDKEWKIPKNGEGPTAITVAMYDNSTTKDPKLDPAEAWILHSTSSNFNLSKQERPGRTQVAGQDAWLYVWDGLYQGTSVVTERGKSIIMFTVTYDGDTDMKKRKDFTTLMGSVRFYEASPSATTTKNK